jgi:hypothetical protein
METELVVNKQELDQTKHDVVIQIEVKQEPIVQVKPESIVEVKQEPIVEVKPEPIVEVKQEPTNTLQVKKVVDNQDASQRNSVIISVLIELYRVISCSLLILFIPQKCDDHMCSVSENLTWESDLYNVAIVFNFITLFAFCPFYFLEIRRENRFIKYLDVNPKLPSDNASVEKSLQILTGDKKDKLVEIDKDYQRGAYCMIFIYAINAILSGIVVNEYYIGTQTTTSLITYILFILTKLANVYEIAHTDEYVFYSAYLKTNLQYNDTDDTYKDLSNRVEEIKEDVKTEIKEDVKTTIQEV